MGREWLSGDRWTGTVDKIPYKKMILVTHRGEQFIFRKGANGEYIATQ